MRGDIEVGSYKLPPKLNEHPEKNSAAGRLGSSPVTIQGKPKCETVKCKVGSRLHETALPLSPLHCSQQ